MPIKQGAPVMITLFCGFGYMVLLFVGFMLLPGWMKKGSIDGTPAQQTRI